MPKIVATKEDWITLGYQRFSESGASALIVDQMSSLLKCNKSSFYWHFKTKVNFIDAIIEYWIAMDTDEIIQEVTKEIVPSDKFIKLIRIVFKKDPSLDFMFYLKKHAQSDKKTKKLVDGIDKERILFTSAILRDMGYSVSDAKVKAQVFYKYLIGYHEMIRYKKQPKHYLSQVLEEINEFIEIKSENE